MQEVINDTYTLIRVCPDVCQECLHARTIEKTNVYAMPTSVADDYESWKCVVRTKYNPEEYYSTIVKRHGCVPDICVKKTSHAAKHFEASTLRIIEGSDND